MQDHRRDDAVYASALAWYVAKNWPAKRWVTLDAAAEIWRVVRMLGLGPTPSLCLLGFEVAEEDQGNRHLMPASDRTVNEINRMLEETNGWPLLLRVQQIIGDRYPVHLQLRGGSQA